VTTSRDPEGRATVYDLLTDVTTFVAPVGRLDLETSGLLLLTNDTRFADRITSPASHVPKTYRVTTSRPLDPEELEALRRGPALRDGPTRPATVRSIDAASFEITITEGRNRQVRRMVEAVGARVTTLARVRIGTVTLGALPPGKWRRLSRAEVTLLSR
jgi:23S rRNA pseudouridine2605 synthase